MSLIMKTAWRNMFRQKRRTLITVMAMAVSLMLAVPTWGLVGGLNAMMLEGITGMELGHMQIHDSDYAEGQGLHSTMRRADELLAAVRRTPGVQVAAPRVRGSALASHDITRGAILISLDGDAAKGLRFGVGIDVKAPWRDNPALACEALVGRNAARKNSVVVGTVLTPAVSEPGGRCERIRIVGLLDEDLEAKAKGRSGESEGDELVVGLEKDDMEAVFKTSEVETSAVLRHAAPLAVEGVEPESERQVTFMADKIVKGRYLSSKPGGEILVGQRLAETLRLGLGDKIFVQAASLDQTQGDFYKNFEVVGIYRTGVDIVDRIRVFIHLQEAQEIMALEDNIHEIAVIGPDPEDTDPTARLLRRGIRDLGLNVSAEPEGKRAGGKPLPSPIYVYKAEGEEAGLIVAHDLRRRFEGLKGVEGLASRVYGETGVASFREVKIRLDEMPEKHFKKLPDLDIPGREKTCSVIAPARWAEENRIKTGEALYTKESAMGGESACPELFIGGTYEADEDRETPVFYGFPADRTEAPKEGATDSVELENGDDGYFDISDFEDMEQFQHGLEPGEVVILIAEKERELRFAGVETVAEKKVSGLDKKLSAGRYIDQGDVDGDGGVTGPEMLLPASVARSLGLDVGGEVLLGMKDAEGRSYKRIVGLAGLLNDSEWDPELPPLILPYFFAQQIDAGRLNARAHELAIIPETGSDIDGLIKDISNKLSPVVRTWQQISPDMARIMHVQDVWIGIILLVIFIIAAMTVMNTMLMAVWERTKEFGVLKSIGMKPRQVIGLILCEALGLAFFAAVVGGIVGSLITQYLVVYGLDLTALTGGFSFQGAFIDPVWRAVFSWTKLFLAVSMMVFVCITVSFYPALRAARLEPVKALRHEN